MIDYTPAFVAAQGTEQRSSKNWRNEMKSSRDRFESEDALKKQIKEIEQQISEEEDIPVSGWKAITDKRDRIQKLKNTVAYLKEQLKALDEQRSEEFYSYSSLPDFTRRAGS
jgi:uncharacterized coiled-coil protein SlyX